jgi:hypothetical protein
MNAEGIKIAPHDRTAPQTGESPGELPTYIMKEILKMTFRDVFLHVSLMERRVKMFQDARPTLRHGSRGSNSGEAQAEGRRHSSMASFISNGSLRSSLRFIF